MASILAFLTILKPFLMPIIAFLAGWIFPSPIQKAIIDQGKINDAEHKAAETHGNVDDLDKLP